MFSADSDRQLATRKEEFMGTILGKFNFKSKYSGGRTNTGQMEGTH